MRQFPNIIKCNVNIKENTRFKMNIIFKLRYTALILMMIVSPIYLYIEKDVQKRVDKYPSVNI